MLKQRFTACFCLSLRRMGRGVCLLYGACCRLHLLFLALLLSLSLFLFPQFGTLFSCLPFYYILLLYFLDWHSVCFCFSLLLQLEMDQMEKPSKKRKHEQGKEQKQQPKKRKLERDGEEEHISCS